MAPSSTTTLTQDYSVLNLNNNVSFNKLPIELVNDIISKIYFDPRDSDTITSQIDNFNKNILHVNKLFYTIGKKYLYRYCIFTRPNSFQNFLTNLNNDHSLGLHVKFLDFMEFTSIGLGRTGKMNQEIQMVTNETIGNCLSLTPNLTEFLASESIDTDIDLNILNYLFKRLKHLKSLDFCGATNMNFVSSFNQLELSQDTNISKISFHDCTNLPQQIFIKLLPYMPKLTRLDLSHTLISAKILNNFLHPEVSLTHLSIARCPNITTRELMEFLIHHTSIKNGDLQWLNLQVDSSMVSPLNLAQLTIILKKIQLPQLRYLNLGGLPIEGQHLEIILERFPYLESLGLSNNQLSMQLIVDFLHLTQTLKMIDLSSSQLINKWTVGQHVLLDASTSLMAIEISNKILDELPVHLKTPLSVWKTFDNDKSSRRGWIYKVSDTEREKILKDAYYDSDMVNKLVYYDLVTGKKVKKLNKQHAFLKYALKKVNCSRGLFLGGEEVFPVEYSERGIHRYYSLNK